MAEIRPKKPTSRELSLQVGLIGEMTSWTDDVMMTHDMANPDLFIGFISVDTTMDGDASGFVDMKFRANHDWAIN